MNSRGVLQGVITLVAVMFLLADASPQEIVPTSTSVAEVPIARSALISPKFTFTPAPLLMPTCLASPAFLTLVEVQKNGVGGVDGLSGIVCVILSPDGKHVYVAGTLSRAVAVFSALSP